MWAQEHELRANRSWLAGVAKGLPIGLMFVSLAAGSAFCQAAPTPDSSSAKSAPPAFRRQTFVLFGREAHANPLRARASSQQINSQVLKAPSASGATAPRQAASAPCTESISRGRHALEIAPNPDSLALTLARDLARCEQLNEAVAHYRQYLQSHPEAEDVRAELGDTLLRAQQPAAAMEVFRALLSTNPQSLDGHLGLARALARRGDYPEALRHYEVVLQASPQHYDALQGKAFVLYWSGRVEPAKALFQRLLVVQPQDPENREALKRLGDAELELARVRMDLKDYAAAREGLVTLLATNPRNEQARMQLAQLALRQNQFRSAARQFDQLLKQNPEHLEARLGRARVAYYLNDLSTAQRLAADLVADRPEDFEAVFLLTQVEHARRHRRQALSLVQQAKQLAPADPEVKQLEKRIREQANFKLRTTASYAREIGQPSAFGNRSGTGPEDLRMSGFGATFEFAFSPRTTSYLSLAYLPSNSPAGGIQGAAGPAQWLYRQDTQLSPQLTLRGGVGAVRFGPGTLQNVPQQSEPISTATIRPLGFGGGSYAPTGKYSLDLEAARNAISYTPISARLGVRENRFSTRLNYFFNPHTELHLEYFFATYSSIQYVHVWTVNSSPVRAYYADHDQAHGGTVTFTRNLRRTEHFRFDAGYEGMAYGFAGARRQVWMGFFNPSFYQRHQFTTHFAGRLWKTLGYDFRGSIGLQQIEQGQALTRAMTLSPTLTYKVNDRFALGLGYTHYNSAQTLGALRGDAVRLTTEWSF